MTSPSSKPSRADDWDTLRREIGPINDADAQPLSDVNTQAREYSDEELRAYANAPLRMIHPHLPPEEWEPAQSAIWVVPDEALRWGYENQHHVHAGNTMILPAVEQEWRDNQHYKAYVRPTKEEA